MQPILPPGWPKVWRTMILTCVPEEDQANVLAHTIAHLGEMFLQKGGAVEGDTTH